MRVGVKKYENKYEVTTEGVVYSLPREINRGVKGVKKTKEIIVSQRKTTTGYFQVMLCSDGKKKYCMAHRIVAEAFIPNPENKPQVNHINGIKTDNRVENLEWVTQSENQKHAVNTGLQPHAIGEMRGKVCKLSSDDVSKIKCLINMGVQSKIIAQTYNVNPVTISNIKTGATWANV